MKRFQPILQAALNRDANESDTVTLVMDILADVLGFDKYADITSEFAIRGTYCDLALKLGDGGKPTVLIEVKAIGHKTEERFVKQAIDYAANQGVEWVILTNGIRWILYHVTFAKPIGQEEVINFNLLESDIKSEEDIAAIYALSKEGWAKCLPAEVHDTNQSLNRFMLGALILSEPILDALRREIKKLSEVKVDNETISDLIETEVIKRDVLDGEKAESCARRVSRFVAKSRKPKSNGEAEAVVLPTIAPTSQVTPEIKPEGAP